MLEGEYYDYLYVWGRGEGKVWNEKFIFNLKQKNLDYKHYY